MKHYHLAFLVRVCALCLLALSPLPGRSQEQKLKPIVQVLGSDAPYSFPEKLVAAPSGDLYLLDTELSNVFVISNTSGRINRLCHPRLPVGASDLSVDARGNIWVLDSTRSRVFALDGGCRVQKNFATRRPGLKLQVNTFGEVAVLFDSGESLFDLYSGEGKLLRSFGKRLSYGDAHTDTALSDGRLISDGSGGFYFSFNYPPLIRRYGRGGNLISEFKPETDMKVGPPEVSAERKGNFLSVTSRYQVVVLALALDGRNRLNLLISGKEKSEALRQGARELLVTTGRGKTLKKISLDHPFHNVAARGGELLLLRNRRPLMLNMYALP